jgi:adenosyl cobinamide kinase/adenosyl cobinamide phosphate guanylyltransferase
MPIPNFLVIAGMFPVILITSSVGWALPTLPVYLFSRAQKDKIAALHHRYCWLHLFGRCLFNHAIPAFVIAGMFPVILITNSVGWAMPTLPIYLFSRAQKDKIAALHHRYCWLYLFGRCLFNHAIPAFVIAGMLPIILITNSVGWAMPTLPIYLFSRAQKDKIAALHHRRMNLTVERTFSGGTEGTIGFPETTANGNGRIGTGA